MMQPALTVDQSTYLVFSLRDSLYAVPAETVREAVWLPELTPLAEAPAYVAGLVNVRGQVVPVTDLAVRLGYAPRAYRLSDKVILLETAGTAAGLLVDEVHEVVAFPTQDLEPAPDYSDRSASGRQFVTKVATLEAGLVGLLDLAAVLTRIRSVPALPEGVEPAAAAVETPDSPAATDPIARDEFRRRAAQLRQAVQTEDVGGLLPLALISLGGEHYGIELSTIREFAHIGTPTPVPCCPPHLVGNVNLRGEILTVVDLRGFLGVAAPEGPHPDCVVVLTVDELCVGMEVDEILDVLYVRPAEVRAIPTALKTPGQEYLSGTVRQGETTLGILEVRELLAREDLTVNEEV